MAWLKSSDTSYDHPVVVAPLEWDAEHLDGLDPYDLVSVLYGLVWRCATYCGGKGLDYVVPDAVIAQMAGTYNWRVRAAQAARAGYWTRAPADAGWLLVDDAEHLFHIRRKAEIEWERARRSDVANKAFTVPVRLRDGDGCRYCGHIVQWGARTGNRAGTYDHRNPGKPAVSPDDLVVACRGCNSTRKDNPHAEAWPLLPAPTDPHYGTLTIEFLAKAGRHITAPGEPAPSRPTPGDRAPSVATPSTEPTGDRSAPRPAGPASGQGEEVREAGRVGSGAGPRRKRARRGRGRRPRGGAGDHH